MYKHLEAEQQIKQIVSSFQIDEYRQIIYGNILRGMRVLLDAARKLDIELHNNSNKVFAEQLLNFNKASAVNQVR